jgi:hypothetical protein
MVKATIEIRQALNIIRRECGKAAQMLSNLSMNNLVKSTLLIWTATLDGGEALLQLRSLKSSGDFNDYWLFHKQQSKKRLYGVN